MNLTQVGAHPIGFMPLKLHMPKCWHTLPSSQNIQEQSGCWSVCANGSGGLIWIDIWAYVAACQVCTQNKDPHTCPWACYIPCLSPPNHGLTFSGLYYRPANVTWDVCHTSVCRLVFQSLQTHPTTQDSIYHRDNKPSSACGQGAWFPQ